MRWPCRTNGLEEFLLWIHKTRNWPAWNEALKRRGSLTIWLDPAMTWEGTPTGTPGRRPDCGDAAIRTCLTLKGEARRGNDPGDRFG